MFNLWVKIWPALAMCIFISSAAAQSGKNPLKIFISKDLVLELENESLQLISDFDVKITSDLIESPPRLVFDISRVSGAQYTIPQPVVRNISGSNLFISVRAASHDDYTRVVIDLSSLPQSEPVIKSSLRSAEVNFSSAAIKATQPQVQIPPPTKTPDGLTFEDFLREEVSQDTPPPPGQTRISPGLSIGLMAHSIILTSERDINSTAKLFSDPPRYVLDISTLNGNEFPIPSPITLSAKNSEVFSAVRIASHLTFTRIVVDLQATPLKIPELRGSLRSVLINFDSESTAEPAIETIMAPVIVESPARDVPAREARHAEIVNPPEVPTPPTEAVSQPVIQEAEGDLRFSVSDLIVRLEYGGRPIRDIKVKNTSKTQLFMTALAVQVENPGLADETSGPTKALLVSPRRFELAPGGERLVRIVVAERDEERESVFRINFVPDSEPFNPNKSQSPLAPINVGISVLALSEPKDPKAELISNWSDRGLFFENDGNRNIFLDQIKACRSNNCSAVPAKRLYAGARWIIPGNDLTSVEFLRKIGDDFENITLKHP